MNEKIVIRQRFPNFVCDGAPLGPPGSEAYYSRFDKTEDFYELDWVKNKNTIGCIGWFSSNEYIMAVYEDPDGFGTYACHAILEEGKLDMDEFDLNEDGAYAKIMNEYGLGVNPKYA